VTQRGESRALSERKKKSREYPTFSTKGKTERENEEIPVEGTTVRGKETGGEGKAKKKEACKSREVPAHGGVGQKRAFRKRKKKKRPRTSGGRGNLFFGKKKRDREK